MRWWRVWTPANRLAAAGALVGAIVCAASARGALRLAALPAPATAAPAEPLPELPVRETGRPELAISAVVARDPFRRDRRRPPERYRPPGQRVAMVPQAATSATRLPALRLLGTASFEDGQGLAAVSIGGGTLRILRVGQALDGLELVRVDRGSATLAGRDTTIVLRLPDRP